MYNILYLNMSNISKNIFRNIKVYLIDARTYISCLQMRIYFKYISKTTEEICIQYFLSNMYAYTRISKLQHFQHFIKNVENISRKMSYFFPFPFSSRFSGSVLSAIVRYVVNRQKILAIFFPNAKLFHKRRAAGGRRESFSFPYASDAHQDTR